MALRLLPQDFPVVAVDHHLPAVADDRLTADALRQRFLAPPPWTPEVIVERHLAERPPAHASVLVPLVHREAGLTVLLTQRTDHLNDHPGQISFPGGRVEAEDADAVATAMREAQEEIGLQAHHAEVLGQMPTYTTGTGFIVTPVVALLDPRGMHLTPDPFEVAEVFEVPLAFLMNPAHHRHHQVHWAGQDRHFFSMPWQAPHRDTPYFIWGATAAMLRNFYRLLRA